MEASCLGGGAAGHTIAAAFQFFAAAQCLLGEPWPHQADIPDGKTVDFIIVGGGTAGSTLAARLSQLPVTVLLLEAGGDPPIESVIPFFKHSLKGSRYDWKFTTLNDSYSSQALIGGSQRQPRGKMLGGSGSMNDMIYARGYPADYDEWAKVLGDEWKWENVLEYFKKTEKLTDVRTVNDNKLASLHGFNGEIEVSGSGDYSYTAEKFLEAFEQLNFTRVEDMTNPHKIGVGKFSLTVKNGKRHSSLAALLNRAAVKENLFVLKNALVLKILIDGNTANGVKVLIGDVEYNFYSQREVIVCAGTFNTAKLLLLSGIGPKEHLQELGIPVVRDLPVGENLHDHTMVLTYMAVDSGTCEFDVKELYLDTIKYLHDKSGILSKSEAIGAYVSFEGNNDNTPDFAFYPVCMPRQSQFYDPCMSILGWRESVCKKIDNANQVKEILSVAVVNLKPVSRGKVKLKSTDPMESPLIYSGTFGDPKDLKYYPDALNIAWSLVNTTYFKGKNAYVLDLGFEECESKNSEERSKCLALASAMSAWHAVGTAAMGSVLDSTLQVYGLTGLRVVDASVMPKIIRGNTNAPVVMIAEKAFNFIKQHYNYY